VARAAATAGGETEAEQPDPEHEMQPVVGGVRGQPAGHANRPEHPEREVDDPASRQERGRTLGGPCEDDADDAEEQVKEVVEDRHLEQPEKLRSTAVTGEAQIAVVARDARDEPEDPHEQEDDPDDPGRRLDGCALADLVAPFS